ncbi:MAG: GDP-mannose 4,6-dehydratase, partial [Burkholderiales bacterium]
ASSANVYGNAQGILSELQPPQPVNHYAASKLAMEHMARTWRHRLPIVVTRPFNYTGVGQDIQFLVPKIVSHFVSRMPVIELGNLDIERDFSDVRMVTHSYRRLLESVSAGEIVNVCSGHLYSLRSIVAMMERIAGYKIEVRVNQDYVRLTDVKTLVGSVDKLHALVGELDPIPLEQTLSWMYRSGVQP